MKISVNGYGTIGKRVAEGIDKHPKLKLVGVAKYTPDQDARLANMLGYRVFVPKESMDKFKDEGINVAGTVEEMIEESDIIADASSDGKGMINKEIYKKKNKPAIFQGGEKAGIAEISFNARSNFEKAKGKKYIRVVSCNTTGYSRVIKPLTENYDIENINAILIRRAADPNDTKGPLNSIEWKANSHHAEDVRTIIDVPMTSIAFKAPHTLSHVNSMTVRFKGKSPSKEDILDIFSKESRVVCLRKASSTSQITEAARDIGLKRYDMYTTNLLMNSIMISGNEMFLTFVVPQESIVVPENIDAIIAQAGLMEKEESMNATDKLLGIDKIKKDIERLL